MKANLHWEVARSCRARRDLITVYTCWTWRAGICQACDIIVYMVRCSFCGDARTHQSHGEMNCRWLWKLLTISTLCWWNRRKTHYCSNAIDFCISSSSHKTCSIVLLFLLMYREPFLLRRPIRSAYVEKSSGKRRECLHTFYFRWFA